MTKLLYVDLETGGLPVSTGIYEVGLIATDNGRIIETLTIGLPINKDRIPEGMGQGYACISDEDAYRNQFKQFVAKYPYPFVAHNASFDRGFLVHYGWVDKDAKFIDTYALFRNHLEKPTQIQNHKLGTIMEYYGVQVDGTLHTAISDLKGLVECVNKSGILGEMSDGVDFKELTDVDRYFLKKVPDLDLSKTPEELHYILCGKVNFVSERQDSFERFKSRHLTDVNEDDKSTKQKYYSNLTKHWVLINKSFDAPTQVKLMELGELEKSTYFDEIRDTIAVELGVPLDDVQGLSYNLYHTSTFNGYIFGETAEKWLRRVIQQRLD